MLWLLFLLLLFFLLSSCEYKTSLSGVLSLSVAIYSLLLLRRRIEEEVEEKEEKRRERRREKREERKKEKREERREERKARHNHDFFRVVFVSWKQCYLAVF